MLACKGRVKIEVIAPVFQEDVAEMGIAMSDDRHSLLRGMQRHLAPLDQVTQRMRLCLPLDDPAIAQQVIECDGLLFACVVINCWQRDGFPGIEAAQAASGQAMPEELVNGRFSMLLCGSGCEGGMIDGKQALALPALGVNEHIERDVITLACLASAHQVEHDGPLYDGINHHLLLFLMEEAQGIDDMVPGLLQQGGMVVFFEDALLLDVRFEKVVLPVVVVNAVEGVERDGFRRQGYALRWQVHVTHEPEAQEAFGFCAILKLQVLDGQKTIDARKQRGQVSNVVDGEIGLAASE